MQDLTALSDVEFEALCADLLARELGLHVERFPPGRDQGVDLRWEIDEGDRKSRGSGIGQCKHYVRSSFSDLNRSAIKEVSKVKELSPSRYLFFTSQSLSVAQKDTIYQHFARWMISASDVYGAEDIQSLLDRHESVQRAHPKLWLHSGAMLFLELNSAAHNQSVELVARVSHDKQRFVATNNFAQASELLAEEHVCVIAGAPGVGKTMLAHALVAEAARNDFEIYEVSSDISEAWQLYDSNAKQFFLYDDFLGQISLRDRLEKNEDARLVRFMEMVSKSKKHCFVLTTREYILREAYSSFAALKEVGERRRFLLEVPKYSQVDRAKILYNHVWHSELPVGLRAQFANGNWRRIVDHHGFSPRLIQYATGELLVSHDKEYLQEFVAILDKPTRLWEQAYDHQIREEQRVLLRILTMFGEAELDDVVDVVSAHGVAGVQLSSRLVERAFRELDQTFISTKKVGESHRIFFHSPAVREFVLELLRTDRHALLQVIQAAQSVGQLLHLSRAGVATRFTNPLTGRAEAIGSSPLPLVDHQESFVARLMELFSVSEFSPESNLANISQLTSGLLPNSDWWISNLERLCIQWDQGEGDPEWIAMILTSAVFDELPDELCESLKVSARARIDYYDFTEVSVWNAVADIFEDVFEEDFPYEVGENFLYFVDSRNIDSCTEGDFGELREFACRIGGEVAEQRIAEQEASKFGDQDRGDDSEDRFYESGSSSVDAAAGELDELFDRFLH